MKRIRYAMVVLALLLCSATSSQARLSVSIGLPNVYIGINLPLYPEMQVVPGYPVYYAPGMDSNYFFYDGMYWVYQDDNWYASDWYNGPWDYMEPEYVPLFVLRIPVSYYRHPPESFRGWRRNEPPRWGQRWGHEWEGQRSGWNRWDRRSAPAPAPLPTYQRNYNRDRYPRGEQQQRLREQNYRYQPRDKDVRSHVQRRENPQSRGGRVQPAAPQRQQPGRVDAPQNRNPRQPAAAPQHQQPGRVDAPQNRNPREPAGAPQRQQPGRKGPAVPVENAAEQGRQQDSRQDQGQQGQDQQNERERGRDRRN